MRLRYAYVMAVLWLRHSCCISQEGGCVMAVHTVSLNPARQGEPEAGRRLEEPQEMTGRLETLLTLATLEMVWTARQLRHEQDQQYNYYDSQKGETTQMSITWWTDKQNVAYTDDRIVFSSKKTKLLILPYVWTWRHHAKWKKASHRGPHVMNLLHNIWKCPE